MSVLELEESLSKEEETPSSPNTEPSVVAPPERVRMGDPSEEEVKDEEVLEPESSPSVEIVSQH